jgi:hypothetical protein
MGIEAILLLGFSAELPKGWWSQLRHSASLCLTLEETDVAHYNGLALHPRLVL